MPELNRNKLRADLERDEGIRLDAYRDSEGWWTIGVGHLLGSKPRMDQITPAECSALFEWDVNTAINELTTFNVPLTMSEPRFRVLVNMMFNLGPTRLRKFVRFWVAVQSEDWDRASQEMLDSKWAEQVGRRALRLAETMRTGKDAA